MYFLRSNKGRKRRKKVAHDIDGEVEGQTTLDDNSNEIAFALQSPSRSSSASNYSDWEEGDDASDNHGNGADHEQIAEFEAKLDGTEATPDWSPASTREHSHVDDDTPSQTKTVSAAPDSTSTDEKRDEQTSAEVAARTESEAQKIAKYLSRRDTAVIYAEPVADTNESQNDEGNCSEEEIILKCIHCPQTFLRAIVLRDHMREMHADKPLKFMCPKCDETFHQKSQLDKHLTLHSPTSQNCPVCSKTFANVYRLQRHMISHDESNDLRKFKCMECGKAFKFKHHLKEHVRIHSGEKPFECPNCRKRFSHSGSYSSHMTSKKCWVVSAHKNRLNPVIGDRSPVQTAQSVAQISQNGVSQSFSSVVPAPAFGMFTQSFPETTLPFPRSPLPSISSSHTLPQTFIPTSYAPQKAIPGYYPPHMFRTPDGMFSYPVFSVPQGLPGQFPSGPRLPNIPGRPVDQGPDQPKENGDVPVTTTALPGLSPATTAVTIDTASHCKTTVTAASNQSFQTSLSQAAATSSSEDRSANMTVSSPSEPEHSPTNISQSSSITNSKIEQICPESDATLLTERDQLVSSSDMETDLESKADFELKSNEAEDVLEDSIPKSDNVEKTDVDEVDGNSKDDSNDSIETKANATKKCIACQFCGEVFDSPVNHHQHERYMCKQNKDIVQHMAQVDSRQSPHSTVSDTSLLDSTATGGAETETDDEELEEMYRDFDTLSDDKNSKMRIRTLFTDEQLNVLKCQYLINPRPRKFELIRIGNKIGFPKRVVQVWFQNMRARDRKQGKDFVYSLEAIKTEQLAEQDFSKSPTYIPNVPQPYPHKLNGHHDQSPAHVQPPSKLPGETPLDLSLSKTPPLAHGGISRLSTPDRSTDNQVLNLSVKRGHSEPKDMRGQSEPKEMNIEKNKQADLMMGTAQQQIQNMASFRDSAIFKYMQQEGMILNKRFPMPPMSLSPSLQQILHNQILSQSMAASVVSALHFPPISSSHLDIPNINTSSSLLFDSKRSESRTHNQPDVIGCGRLVIDEHMKEVNSTSREMTPLYRGEAAQYSELPEDTHNLSTLAEAAQHAANILSGKPKRLRKKTWRQMESEEVQLDLEDSSMSADDDEPAKKKRKSWKNHRVDREEGMYACDQCNKMFSKQSSLARHKYEHSGARPFLCDLCPKSFKHKHHLTEHKRLHSGEKPFQCKKCGKRFSHSGSFSQHMNHRYNYCSPHKPGDPDEDISM